MKPVTFDGWTYVLIAFFGAVAAAFATDDAAKYIDPAPLWLLKNLCTAISASLLALKMFRSTAYADYKSNGKTPNGNGALPPDPRPAAVTAAAPADK
jgi:hypothetical protein